MLTAASIFVFLTVAFLILFFSAVPNPALCRLPSRRKGRFRPAGLLILVSVYSLLAFYRLGETQSPQSFVPMAERTAVITFQEARQPERLVFFPGVGTGNYSIEVSDDQENWFPVTEFYQDHVSVLKWQFLELSLTEPWKHIRMVCKSGAPWLGELSAEDAVGNRIPFICNIMELSDEGVIVPGESTFLNSSYFDEIYHARTAWEHLNRIWPYEISHPPLGKEILSLGILLFGMTPFGWRFSGTVTGILMLPVMYALLRKLFGGNRIPLLGTTLLGAGFMHYVQTRIATIDSYAVFFILLMFLFMYEWLREDRLLALGLCGLFFGLGAACKWICLYAGAGLALLWLVCWINRLKTGERSLCDLIKNIFWCLLFFILIPALIYYLSYIPYGLAEDCRPFESAYTKLVFDNQLFMFNYHAQIVAEHPYSSRWYQWLLDIRPILYYLQYYSDGTRVSFGAFVNPLICWGGLIALLFLLFCAIFRRDRLAAFLLIAWLSGILPWIFISRLTFEYHYFASAVFLIPALCYIFSLMEAGTKYAGVLEYSFCGFALLLFVLFFPALNGIAIDNTLGSKLLGWLPSWPF
ncbi:MAG: glycosyltransferase family 39 protein [Oscillospiraceae bacterium]|nr:glycosyltransferase family 39 protein [Oscillospiraceae bacterium]